MICTENINIRYAKASTVLKSMLLLCSSNNFSVLFSFARKARTIYPSIKVIINCDDCHLSNKFELRENTKQFLYTKIVLLDDHVVM